ncbi:MAG: LemA family protein [Bdellovibrionota bacterium]
MLSGWVLVAVVIGVPLLLFIILYNSLVAAKNQCSNGWAQIDVQLKRRADLIPNLVEAVKGAMSHERETLENVVKWRNQAAGLQNSPDLAARVQAESALSGALGRLLVVMENYPQLRATENIGRLQEELTSTENRIGFARQHYNDVSTKFNTKIEQIPTNFIAGIASMKPFPLFEVTEAADRAVPKVSLK